MIFRPSRTTRDDRFLDQKLLIFSVGAVCAVAGIAFDVSWLIYAAIGVLLIGLLLRLLPHK